MSLIQTKRASGVLNYNPGTFDTYRQPYSYLGQLLEFWVLNFVLVWLYNYFDLSVTDESYVDETRVWRIKL